MSTCANRAEPVVLGETISFCGFISFSLLVMINLRSLRAAEGFLILRLREEVISVDSHILISGLSCSTYFLLIYLDFSI